MAEGLSVEAFAGMIRVNRDTVYNWCEIYPEFAEAKSVGECASQLFWEKLLRAQAAGKIVKGNPASAIFVMKNRFKWRDVHDVNHAGKDGGPIQYRDLTQEEQKQKAVKGLERLISALTR